MVPGLRREGEERTVEFHFDPDFFTNSQLIWSMCFVNLHRRGAASELRGLSTKPGTLPEMQAALRRAPSPGLRGLSNNR